MAKATSAQLAYYYRNRDAILSKKRESYKTDRERSVRLQRTYGITAEDWEELFDAQGRVCAICETTEPMGSGWCVDHDHACCPQDGRSCGLCIRGILCPHCNSVLGYAKDSAATLAAAIVYLEGLAG